MPNFTKLPSRKKYIKNKMQFLFRDMKNDQKCSRDKERERSIIAGVEK